MDAGVLVIAIFLSLMLFLLLGLPVAFCLFGIAMAYLLIFLGPERLYIAFSAVYNTSITDIFIAVPLFIFMSVLLEFTGVGSALYSAVYEWFGRLRGGLAITTVAICTILAALTGLGGTGVLIMGVLALPEMLKRNYNKSLALGCIPAASTLGPLIPPSVPMIVIGGLSNQSVGRLFAGGVVPGLLMSFLFILYIGIRCALQPDLAPSVSERVSWRVKFISLRGIIVPVVLILFVLGSIWSGAATPTEAAGIGAIGSLLYGIINRQLTLSNLKKAVINTFKINGMVMWLLIGGSAFSSLMGMSGVTHFIQNWLVGLQAPYLAIVFTMAVGLVLGMFMDAGAIIVMTIPIFMPVIIALGFDPVWFGVLYTVNMVIGYLTPPFGMNLFYMKGIVPKDITLSDIYRSVQPFIAMQVVVLVLCVAFPKVITWLPDLLFK